MFGVACEKVLTSSAKRWSESDMSAKMGCKLSHFYEIRVKFGIIDKMRLISELWVQTAISLKQKGLISELWSKWLNLFPAIESLTLYNKTAIGFKCYQSLSWFQIQC